MLVNRPLLVAAFLAATLAGAYAQTARADEALIRQVEHLRDSLNAQDSMQIRALTTKLANLHFSEALAINAQEKQSPDAAQQIAAHRKRAIALFEGFLKGENGRYEPPTGEQSAATRHNLARLYADTDQIKKATALWKVLVEEADYPNIASEAALSLAELEVAANPASNEAVKHFRVVLQHDKRPDTVNYAHYQIGWIFRNQEKWREAIEELKQSLYDAKGQAKEEVIGDLVTMYAASDISARDALAYFRQLGEKVGHPDLTTKLADAYVAAGKKPEAIAALASVVASKTSPLHIARLMEESYGTRDWTTFTSASAQARSTALKGTPDADVKEVQKILKRLTVQLDAEKATAKENVPEFVASVDTFLHWFPKDEDAFKMVQATISVQDDDAKRGDRIKQYLDDKTLNLKTEERFKLREQLVSTLTAQGKHEDAAKEAQLAAQDTTDAKEKRRLHFIAASELFDGGKEKESLPLFQILAKENPTDEFGVKSQMVATRLLGKGGDYAAVLASSAAWLAAVDGKADVKNSKEYKAVVEVRDRSEFENAVALGDKPEALAAFRKFCLAGAFLPKSCANAESLAVKLGNYTALIEVLKSEKKTDEVTQILETSGRFADAAHALDAKLIPGSPVTERLHVALLYEIAGQNSNRDRVLDEMVGRLDGKPFASADEENLVFLTLTEAGRLPGKASRLKWSDEHRCTLLDRQLASGSSDRKTADALLACRTAPGPAWSREALARAAEFDQKQRKMTFYSGATKRKFENRMAAINTFGKEVERLLPAADTPTYVTLATKVQTAFENLATEVEQTPIPKEATPEMTPEIQKALAEMAAPFREKAAAYAKMATDEKARVAPSATDVASAPADPKPLQMVSPAEIQPEISVLNNDPRNKLALQKIREIFQQKGNRRVASYFDGRLQQTEAMH